MYTSNIVNFSTFKVASGFSKVEESDQKIVAEKTPLENKNAPENKGLQEPQGYSLDPGSEEQANKPTRKQKAAKAKVKSKKGKVAPASEAPGPLGHAHDAETLSATDLKARYPLTYSSWKNRKHECAKKGGKWFYPADFAGFLKVAGPRLHAHLTLNRIDNANPDYGPGLSEWNDKHEQNNNKGNNIAIIDPVTGEKWTSHKLAKKHNVKLETIHKRRSLGYTDLEMIAGKQDSTLAGVDALLKKHLPAPVAKTTKPKLNMTPMAPPKERRKKISWPTNFARPDPHIDDPYLDDPEDHRQKAYNQRVQDCWVWGQWMAAWNRGDLCTLYPPQTKSFTDSIDMGKYVLPASAVKAPPVATWGSSPAIAIPAAPVEPDGDEQVNEDYSADAFEEIFDDEAS